MKFQFISDHRETFKVGRMCNVFNVSRSGYYAWANRSESPRSIENRALKVKIRVLHAASHGIYGSPKIYLDLKDEGIRCSKNSDRSYHERGRTSFSNQKEIQSNNPVQSPVTGCAKPYESKFLRGYTGSYLGWRYHLYPHGRRLGIPCGFDRFIQHRDCRLVSWIANDPSTDHRGLANGRGAKVSIAGFNPPYGPRQSICIT